MIKTNLNFKELLLLCLFATLIFITYVSESLKPTENLMVTFFDVGQGDSILFQTPKNIKILVDGGPDNKVSNHLGKQLAFLDDEIDVVVATHDDADHIFGLIKVLEKYNVKVLFTSLPHSNNSLMRELAKIAEQKNTKIVHIQNQSILKTEDGVQVNFLFPAANMDTIEDGNSASVVTQIIFGESKILLTGDLGINGENYLVNIYGDSLKSNILKLGHHGSDTSSGPIFLQAVHPQVAIVSAGKNNKFGHPHQSVLDLLNNFKIPYLETAKVGNITLISNGTEIWRE